jgi:hypothetical protein
VRAAILFAAIVLAPAVSGALAILPVQDDRSIAVAYLSNPGANVSAVPSPPFSDFDEFVGGVGIANASQTSTIGATGISGSSQTGVDGSGDGSGASVFDLTFRVDEVVGYALTGLVSTELESDAYVALLGPSGALYEPALTPGGAEDSLSDSGTLNPGVDYRLVISSSHPDGMSLQATQWTFGFDITAVPEPTTGLLCALGLLGVALARRD